MNPYGRGTEVSGGVFAAVGRFSFRHRWLVVAVWVVLFGLGLVATPWLGEALQGGGWANPDAPSQQADALLRERLGQGSATMIVVFEGDGLKATGERFRAAEGRIVSELEAAGIPGLTDIQTYESSGLSQLISRDGSHSLAILTFETSSQAAQQQTDEIRAVLHEAASQTALTTYLTGEPAINADLSSASLDDLRKVELYALPVALLALIVVFGTVVSAALPVIAGGLAVSVTLGVMYLVAQLIEMSIFSMNTATLLGLAVAIDYALFIVARFREELHGGASVEEAVVRSTANAGRSVFYSGVAVVVGMVGLAFFPSAALRSLAVGGGLVVVFSVAASLTLTPALLALLGYRVDSLRVVPQRPAHESRFWTGWAARLVRRPWLVVAVSLIAALLVASPALDMRGQMVSAASLPAKSESSAGYRLLAEEFDASLMTPMNVVLAWEDGGDMDMMKAAALYSFGKQLGSLPGVESVVSPFTIEGAGDITQMASLWPLFQQLLNDPASVPDEEIKLGDMTISAEQVAQLKLLVQGSVGEGAALFRVSGSAPPDSEEGQRLLESVQGLSVPAGMQLLVGGAAAEKQDFFGDVSERLPWVVAWIAASSYLILLFLLRTLLLPLLAVAVNWLTIAMSMGCLVIIFQRDVFESLLQFTSTGATEIVIPIVLLCVLFGITMDYAVFLLTRMREAWTETGDTRLSVGAGLIRSGRVVVSAALLVVIVTGAFAFTSVAPTKALGVCIALTIVLDAVLVRMALLPASMCLMGAANWWAPKRWRHERAAPAETAGADGHAQDAAAVATLRRRLLRQPARRQSGDA